MVDKKNVCLYRLNRETGKICYMVVDLYIFGDDYETRSLVINIPFVNGTEASYITAVPEHEYKVFQYWRCGHGYEMFWCSEPDAQNAKMIFENYLNEKIDTYSSWIKEEEQTLKKMVSMHPDGEGILPVSEWRCSV